MALIKQLSYVVRHDEDLCHSVEGRCWSRHIKKNEDYCQMWMLS